MSVEFRKSWGCSINYPCSCTLSNAVLKSIKLRPSVHGPPTNRSIMMISSKQRTHTHTHTYTHMQASPGVGWTFRVNNPFLCFWPVISVALNPCAALAILLRPRTFINCSLVRRTLSSHSIGKCEQQMIAVNKHDDGTTSGEGTLMCTIVTPVILYWYLPLTC